MEDESERELLDFLEGLADDIEALREPDRDVDPGPDPDPDEAVFEDDDDENDPYWAAFVRASQDAPAGPQTQSGDGDGDGGSGVGGEAEPWNPPVYVLGPGDLEPWRSPLDWTYDDAPPTPPAPPRTQDDPPIPGANDRRRRRLVTQDEDRDDEQEDDGDDDEERRDADEPTETPAPGAPADCAASDLRDRPKGGQRGGIPAKYKWVRLGRKGGLYYINDKGARVYISGKDKRERYRKGLIRGVAPETARLPVVETYRKRRPLSTVQRILRENTREMARRGGRSDTDDDHTSDDEVDGDGDPANDDEDEENEAGDSLPEVYVYPDGRVAGAPPTARRRDIPPRACVWGAGAFCVRPRKGPAMSGGRVKGTRPPTHRPDAYEPKTREARSKSKRSLVNDICVGARSRS